MRAILFCAVALIASVAAAAGETALDFAAGKAEMYGDKTRVAARGSGSFTVVSAVTNKRDTAWSVASAPVAVPAGAKAAVVAFEIFSDVSHRRTECHGEWSPRLAWLGADGRELERFPIPPEFLPGAWRPYRLSAPVPAGAAQAALCFGVDNPDLSPGTRVEVRNARIAFHPDLADLPGDIAPDTHYPLVTRRFESPTADANVVAKFEITDPSGIDWDGVAVSVRGETGTVPFAREGNVIALKHGPWAKGQNTLVIKVRDRAGNAGESHQAFLIGEKPAIPDVTLRADGVALIGGEPFFPIGVYAVNPRDFNAYDLDRGLADLKDAGFNLVHSYDCGTTPEMLAAVARHGMRQWTIALSAAEGSTWVSTVGRHESSILAWYLGDDTAANTTPERLADRHQTLKALDGRRLTCQADSIMAANPKDRYQDYVRHSDVFMPETYPVIGVENFDRACVAAAASDVRRFFADVKKHGDGSPKAVWPVIQNFRGYDGWKRYPTRDELYAMCFAAIAEGAQGFVFYTYGGYANPDKGTVNCGITATPAAWAATTNVTRHVSALIPALTAPAVPQPPAPTVLSGAKTDPHGAPSISVRLLRKDGETWLIAVNKAPEPVRARFTGLPDGAAEVLWENRTVSSAGAGFEDDFRKFGVHVYRWTKPAAARAPGAESPRLSRNVRDFGAKGDGVTLDTAAIQRAIDAVAAAGGGEVVLTRGVYLSGTVYLKSHVTLRLERSGSLRGSPDLKDYNAEDAYPQNWGSPGVEHWRGHHLILALEQEDVAVVGEGIVDGNGRAFFSDLVQGLGTVTWRFGAMNAKDRKNAVRAGQMVTFVECRGVRVEGVRLYDSPSWNCFCHGCENVRIRDVTAIADIRHHNTDGFDIDCCRDVVVSGCEVETGDDCFTVRADVKRLKTPRICENIRFENCRGSCSACGVRVGVGDGAIRNVVFSNLVIRTAGYGICLQSNYSGAKRRGVDISNVRFEDFTVRDAGWGLAVVYGAGAPSSLLRDVTFVRGTVEAALPLTVSGGGGVKPDNVAFSDLALSVKGDRYIEPRAEPVLVEKAGRVSFDRVTLDGRPVEGGVH